MRIFHLVPNMNFGGLQKVVRLLAACQSRAGHEVTVGCWINQSNNPDADREIESDGARVVYLRRAADGGISYGRMSSFHTLRGHLGAGNADILHVHNPFGYYLYGALAARAAGRTKIVNTIHLTAMFDHPRFGRSGRVKFWASAMLTHKIVSVCEEVETYLRSRFTLPANKFSIVDNGIDFAPFLSVPPRQVRDEIVFGFAGRMAPEKNHRVLINAFSLLLRKHGNVRLRLLGGGTLEPRIKEQVRSLGLEDTVTFCGFSNDVAGFLGGLDIYVLPSDFEALPLSLLEAIASGLPAVATSVGGVPTVMRNTGAGWLSPPDNADALAAAMELAIASSGRNEQAERARGVVADLYSADRMAAGYEQVYRELLA